jgi:hypothetical protein
MANASARTTCVLDQSGLRKGDVFHLQPWGKQMAVKQDTSARDHVRTYSPVDDRPGVASCDYERPHGHGGGADLRKLVLSPRFVPTYQRFISQLVLATPGGCFFPLLRRVKDSNCNILFLKNFKLLSKQ